MGTRCIIDIQDGYGKVGLYHHFDGYPENMVPFIQEVKLWLNSVLTQPEQHCSHDACHVASAFSQYELDCIKEMKAESEAAGEEWHKCIRPVGSFEIIPDISPINFDDYFDIEFSYEVDVSKNPWQISAYEVMRYYEQVLMGRFPEFTDLKHCEVPEETSPLLFKCDICGDLYSGKMMHKDHKQPKSKGGKGKPFNKRYVCANCHNLLHRSDERKFSPNQQKLFRDF